MEKLTINVDEMAEALGISYPKAYELAKSEGFPALRIGKRIIVPIEAFKNWVSSSGSATSYGHANR